MAGYHLRPNIDSAVDIYWANKIEETVVRTDVSAEVRHQNLLVLSLNFRNLDRLDISWKALQQADSLLPGDALTKGLLALYSLEADKKSDVIKYFKQGALLNPNDPNFIYLADLDTLELEYIDIHMLEGFFVDTIVNAKLETSLYHKMDSNVLNETKRKKRISGAIDRTFIVSGIAAFFVIVWSIFRIIRFRKRRKKLTTKKTSIIADNEAHVEDANVAKTHVEADEEENESTDVLDAVSKPVKYMILISSMLKIGQVVTSLFNYFMLGSDISEFVSGYVFTPSNLFSLFTENLLFAGVFVIIIIFESIRRVIKIA